MIEIQQLIVKAKVNSDDSEDQNLVQTIESIIDSHIKSKGFVKEVEKKEIIEECIRAVMDKIEFKSRT
tara:strand:+ start:16500 stop:16703 length:204 start_codon:yes stop_codon:yes gene_type:complete